MLYSTFYTKTKKPLGNRPGVFHKKSPVFRTYLAWSILMDLECANDVACLFFD